MYTAAVFVALVALADASELRANSEAGRTLLSKSRKLNDENYYNWIKDYSLVFTGCSSIPSFDAEDGQGMSTTLLAQFKLCPSGSCDSCENGGEYVSEMQDFVQAQQEAARTWVEYECESQLQTCENSCGGDDDGCQYQCMSNAGASSCYNEEEEQKYEEWIECNIMDNGMYYTGAHCVDGGVYLNTFTDSSCTQVAPEGTFYSVNGYNLPADNLISDECISCNAPDDGENDYYYQGEPMDVCTELYEGSSKCEESLGSQYPDTSGCKLIKTTLPSLNETVKVKNHRGAAWFFFFTSLFLGAYALLLHKKSIKASSSDYTGGRFS